jgi:small subunit ribosomal protein S15
MISTKEKNQLIEKFRVHESDTGSVQVQVAVLTARIQQLTDHLKQFTKDYGSRRGLLKMVGTRRRLLNYLKKSEFNAYTKLITDLGLRK